MGNDVEDDTIQAPPKELVKKNTSSKKADVPPAKADPAKAKKQAKVTGNSAAFKNKADNKSVNAPAPSAAKTKKPFDRHSRTNKTDSKKKFKQGWGDNDPKGELEAETEGLKDAQEELAAETVVEEEQPKAKSLADHLEELKVQQQGLTPSKSARKANEGSEAKWTSEEQIVKEQEVLVNSTSAKKVRSKQQKAKNFLDFEATFSDEQPKREEKKTGYQGKKPFAGKKPFDGKKAEGKKPFAGKKASPKPEINDKNFPSL